MSDKAALVKDIPCEVFTYNAEIYLFGCKTYKLAQAIQVHLGMDVRVYGTMNKTSFWGNSDKLSGFIGYQADRFIGISNPPFNPENTFMEVFYGEH